MRRRSLIASVTLLSFTTLMVWPHGARAQTEPKPADAPAATPATPTTPTPASDDATMAQAKQHFETGRNAYNAGDYVTAIREFKAAEQLRPSPILDYNIGLANEKLGKRRVAVKYDKRYLEEQPNASNKAITCSVAGFTAVIWAMVVAIYVEDKPLFVRERMHRSENFHLDRRCSLLEPLTVRGHADARVETEVHRHGDLRFSAEAVDFSGVQRAQSSRSTVS